MLDLGTFRVGYDPEEAYPYQVTLEYDALIEGKDVESFDDLPSAIAWIQE